MQCVVGINPEKKEAIDYKELGEVTFGKIKIIIGIVELAQPDFDASNPDNSNYVLLRVDAFSCNYRDKSHFVQNYIRAQKYDRLYVPFGSEFCATVVAVGEDVEEFAVGDKVMSNCAYPDSGVKGVLPGVATNFVSLGWLRLHKNKLMKIPDTLNDIEASSFSLGAQTASSMIRRSGILNTGGRPLVFSARSATSLFIIKQLTAYGFEPLCLSTGKWSEEDKEKIYPAQVEPISEAKNLQGKFSHVFDPFFDMNIGKAIDFLQMGGTYITCGLRDQHQLLSDETPGDAEAVVRNAIVQSIVKNVSIIGNCLGTTDDLTRALKLQEEKNFKPIIDKVYSASQGAEFVERSFFDFGRFGKCVLKYN